MVNNQLRVTHSLITAMIQIIKFDRIKAHLIQHEVIKQANLLTFATSSWNKTILILTGIKIWSQLYEKCTLQTATQHGILEMYYNISHVTHCDQSKWKTCVGHEWKTRERSQKPVRSP